MKHQEIIARVARGAELPSRRSAEQALRAVLETLAERIDPTIARNAAERLPLETGVYLHDAPRPVRHPPKDIESFLDRVGGRLALTRPDALRVSRAVIATIASAAGEDIVLSIRESLPFAWRSIFESARIPVPPPMPPTP